MKIQRKIISVVIPLIVFPLVFIALMATQTAKDGITRIAKDFLSYKLEDFYKNVSYQYEVLNTAGLMDNREFVEKSYQQIEEYSKNLKLSDTGYVQVITAKGDIFISPVDKGKNISETSLFKQLVSNNFGWIEFEYNNEKKVGMYIYFSGWDWYLLISENEKQFYSDTQKIQLQIILIGLVTILIVFIVLSVVVGKITFPIKALDGTINDIIESYDLTKKVDIYYKDEIGNLSASFNIMTESLDGAYNEVKNYAYKAIVARDNEKRIRTIFQKYVPKEVVEQMLEISQKDASMLIGNKQICTILFSDIRDFTTISESLKADELVNSLNQYFNYMVDKIIANKGIVDKFIGDAIMAVFGVPVSHGNDAYNTIKSGFQMLQALKEFNKKQTEHGKINFRIGVGISTGEVIAGNIGSEQKVDYTVIGDPVNTASRLEGLTKVYKVPILISEYTKVYIENDYRTRELDLIRPKGKTIPFAIYQPFEKISKEEEDVLKFYQEGLRAYKQKNWDKAIQGFSKAYDINEDGPSLMYIDRCKYYMESPPPKDWDGVYVFKTK